MPSGHRRQRESLRADPQTPALEADAVFEPGSGGVPVNRTPPIRVWRRPLTGWDRAFAAVFAALLLGVGALFLSMGRQDDATDARLRADGIQTVATITAVAQDQRTLTITVTFTADGHRVDVQAQSPDGDVTLGRVLPVTYDPADPAGGFVLVPRAQITSGGLVEIALAAPFAAGGLVQLARLLSPPRRRPSRRPSGRRSR